MRTPKKHYSFMACRKNFWLVSVIVIALGLIANILMGVRMDIRFTGGTLLRYSYPESGIVSGADVPASTLPEIVSVTDTQPDSQPASATDGQDEVQNEPPAPADVPVINSGSDSVEEEVSSSDQQIVSDAQISGGDVTGSDLPAGSETASDGDLLPESEEADYSTNVIPNEAERVISQALGEDVKVQISTDASTASGGENKRLIVTFEKQHETGEDTDELIREVMGSKYPNVRLTLRETSSVDPAAGIEFLGRCVVAVGLAMLFMVLYIGLRFRQIGGWTAAFSAIIAIVHDCLAAYFAFVLFRFPISDQFIAVVLAIIGHSLNSTIVIFDRMRENRRLLGDGVSYAELADRSINESLGRTVCTDLCVFVAVAALAAVSAIFGLHSMLGFAVPMMFGVVAGCYSSLCISGTLWVTWQEFLEKHDRRRRTPGM